ncbi:MAG TPA: peptide chain release factor 3, partial [Clostridiales bacterium]|nr:peptide chain release factor 3 [Clostridiales bacterium]
DESTDLKKYENSRTMLVYDRFERPVYLFSNQYAVNAFKDRVKEIELLEALNVTNEVI